MWIYSFSGDREAVEGRLEDEAQMSVDERLDALGWDIYLLARARGDNNEGALALAMQDPLHMRQKVRRDFVVRSVRQLRAERARVRDG
jgi:hypothetical protein